MNQDPMKGPQDDPDVEERSHGQISQIRKVISANKIKLWLPPYYVDDSPCLDQLWETTMVLAPTTGLAEGVFFEALRELQQKALDKLKARTILEDSDAIRLKLKISKNLVTGVKETIEVKRRSTGFDLATKVAAQLNMDPNQLRLISNGRVLKMDQEVLGQDVKPGSSVMVLKINDSDKSFQILQEQRSLLEGARADVELLGGEGDEESSRLSIADQSGQAFELPDQDRKALIMSMSLHEKGRAAMNKSNFDLALVLLLEADHEYSLVRPELIQNIDNFGLLNLEIAWCYVQLGSIGQLEDAVVRLQKGQQILEKAHGPNLERLKAIKGHVGAEKSTYMRMHLLQGIAHYHSGDPDAAKKYLRLAKSEFDTLQVPDDSIEEVKASGFTKIEAIIALQATSNNVTEAIVYAQEKKEHLEKTMKEDMERKMKRRKYGKTVNGNYVNIGYVNTLKGMGFPEDFAMTALKHTDNDINQAIDLIQREPDILETAIQTALTDKAERPTKKERRELKETKKLKDEAMDRMKEELGEEFNSLYSHHILSLDLEKDLIEKYYRILQLN